MSDNKKWIGDILKLTGSVANTAFHSASEAKQQLDSLLRARINEILKEHDLVTREEFDVVREMAEKARKENEELKSTIKKLESKKAK